MEAAPKPWDRVSLMRLTGENLLLLRIKLGRSVRDIVEAELDRRSGAAPARPERRQRPAGAHRRRRRRSRTRAA